MICWISLLVILVLALYRVSSVEINSLFIPKVDEGVLYEACSQGVPTDSICIPINPQSEGAKLLYNAHVRMPISHSQRQILHTHPSRIKFDTLEHEQRETFGCLPIRGASQTRSKISRKAALQSPRLHVNIYLTTISLAFLTFSFISTINIKLQIQPH